MKKTEHLLVSRKKKKMKKWLRGSLYMAPALMFFVLVTGAYILSYDQNRERQHITESEYAGQDAVDHKAPEQGAVKQENKEHEPARGESVLSISIEKEKTKEEVPQQAVAAKPEPEYALFVIAEGGYLTAYSGDRKEVYEYTWIPLEEFPLEQQAMLTGGIYMKTMADYYDFLESFSS